VVYHSRVPLIFARLEPLNMENKSPSLVCHPTNPCRSVGVGKVADIAFFLGVVGWFLHGLVVYLGLSRFLVGIIGGGVRKVLGLLFVRNK
jgi:hypothetical protein